MSSTFAANININSGPIEFGQGIAQTTACSGETPIVITPQASFINQESGGGFEFSSVKVSNIPDSCDGKDFIIKAWGASGDPLSLVGSCAYPGADDRALVYFDGSVVDDNSEVPPQILAIVTGAPWNVARFGAGSPAGFAATYRADNATGLSEVTGDSFTLKIHDFFYCSPTDGAEARSISRITIETAEGMSQLLSCADGGACTIGDTGPGGGYIFYIDEPDDFDWNYLEVAPTNFDGNGINFCTYKDGFPLTDSGPTDDNPASNPFATAIGTGFENTNKLVNNCDGGAGVQAANYTSPNGVDDWFLPSNDELELLLPLKTILGIDSSNYWSSSEMSKLVAPSQAAHTYGRQCWFGTGQVCGLGSMAGAYKVRPIRSF
ncbi:MAG: hypothetical protein F2690_00725 [Actinobacteria bacterium]|nr:hypothetical protein [Actinomycetota bacterium]MSX71579.1 hypothetical protein [Actinomycetota bacterium]MSY69083.1 hypothetical protein [Actinomycetota bacterium]MTA75524.1 hypothetical protein [Actinomycetota bacterium]